MVSLSWVLAKYSCSLLRRADILFVSRLSLPWYSPCVSWSWCWPLNWVSPGYNGCRTMCTCLYNYNPLPGAIDWHCPLWCCTSVRGSQRGQAWLVSRVLIEITDCSAQLHSWALFFIPIPPPLKPSGAWELRLAQTPQLQNVVKKHDSVLLKLRSFSVLLFSFSVIVADVGQTVWKLKSFLSTPMTNEAITF